MTARPGLAVLLAAAAIVAVLPAVSGCGSATGGGGTSASPLWPTASPSASAPASANADGTTAPLTGLPVSDEVASRPAVAVPVVETDGGTPPAGLSDADLVYQEFYRPGASHLLAVYQSRPADRIGPVDITRPVDVKLLPVLHPAYAYAGGPTGFVIQVDKAGLSGVNRSSTPKAFHGNGTATYTSTKLVTEHASHKLDAPPPVLSFGEPDDELADGAKHGTKVTVRVPGQHTQVWRYDADAKVWRRTSGGAGVAVANLVVQRVGYKSIANNGGVTASALATGKGHCVAAARGETVDCRWSRPGRERQTNYTDATAAALQLQPGATWVLLAPPGTKVTT